VQNAFDQGCLSIRGRPRPGAVRDVIGEAPASQQDEVPVLLHRAGVSADRVVLVGRAP